MYVRQFTSEIEDRAYKELNELPNGRDEALKHIREWLSKQPHLNARTDEIWLLNFLRGCKFNLEKTENKLDYFYKQRTLIPDFFTNRDPLSPDIQNVLKRGILLPYSIPDKEVMIIRWDNADPNEVSLINIMKVGLMLLDILIYENETNIIVGHYIINDYKMFNWNYIKQFPPWVAKKIICCFMYAYPNRIKGFYFINFPPSFAKVLKLVKPFLSKKMFDRVKTYTEDKCDDLYKEIPIAFLPKEYGGKGPSVVEIADNVKRKMESYREWFLDDEQYRSDESRRPKKEMNGFSIFGL